jgi:hypothetical protein
VSNGAIHSRKSSALAGTMGKTMISSSLYERRENSRRLGLSPGRPAVHVPDQSGEQEGNDRMVTVVLLCPVSFIFGFPFSSLAFYETRNFF